MLQKTTNLWIEGEIIKNLTQSYTILHKLEKLTKKTPKDFLLVNLYKCIVMHCSNL